MAGFVADPRDVTATKLDETDTFSGRMPPNSGESCGFRGSGGIREPIGVAGELTWRVPDAQLACDATEDRRNRARRQDRDRRDIHTDYAEVCVKPRICGDGLCSWGCCWISRLNVSGGG